MTPDPWLFSTDAIDAETAAFNDQIRQIVADAPDITTIPPPLIRDARVKGESIFGVFETSARGTDRTIEGSGGSIGLREFVPETDPRGVYLHIHGGGWMLGTNREHDVRNEALARDHSIATVSVDYRLAPEHPYPAGPDDCETAARWLIEHCLAEYGTERMAIGGESAGAHLAVVTLLRMRDRHGFTGFRAANLQYGAYDLALTPSAANWGDAPLILSTKIIEWFQEAFVDRSLTRDPDVSPLYANLHDLPPALFTVGTLDPLLDDSLFMAQRWASAGSRAELVVYPGGIHAFDYFQDLPLGQAVIDDIHTFIAGTI